jgi:hypothetical protein
MTSTLLAYAVPALLITMLPRPGSVVVITTAVTGGRRAAVRAAGPRSPSAVSRCRGRGPRTSKK